MKAPIHLLYNDVQVAEAADSTASNDQYSFTIINHRHIGNMDLDRAFLVEKVVRLGFTNGILSHVVMRKRSEAVQAVKLPLAVLDTILSVPANFAAKIAAGTANSTSADQLADVELPGVVGGGMSDAMGDATRQLHRSAVC